MEIDIVTFIMNGSIQLTVPSGRQEYIEVTSRNVEVKDKTQPALNGIIHMGHETIQHVVMMSYSNVLVDLFVICHYCTNIVSV